MNLSKSFLLGLTATALISLADPCEAMERKGEEGPNARAQAPRAAAAAADEQAAQAAQAQSVKEFGKIVRSICPQGWKAESLLTLAGWLTFFSEEMSTMKPAVQKFFRSLDEEQANAVPALYDRSEFRDLPGNCRFKAAAEFCEKANITGANRLDVLEFFLLRPERVQCGLLTKHTLDLLILGLDEGCRIQLLKFLAIDAGAEEEREVFVNYVKHLPGVNGEQDQYMALVKREWEAGQKRWPRGNRPPDRPETVYLPDAWLAPFAHARFGNAKQLLMDLAIPLLAKNRQAFLVEVAQELERPGMEEQQILEYAKLISYTFFCQKP